MTHAGTLRTIVKVIAEDFASEKSGEKAALELQATQNSILELNPKTFHLTIAGQRGTAIPSHQYPVLEFAPANPETNTIAKFRRKLFLIHRESFDHDGRHARHRRSPEPGNRKDLFGCKP